MNNVVILVKKGGDRGLAQSLANKIESPIVDVEGEGLTVVFDSTGVSLVGYGLTFQGDFEGMLRRVTEGRIIHEMLVKAAKCEAINSATGGVIDGFRRPTAIDATAGMGEDSFLLAAYGYDVTLHEQNLVVACLLKDAIRRGKKNQILRPVMERMHVVEGKSEEILANRSEAVDLIYLDPMFPGRQKSSLVNKKLQLIQKMEPPCSAENELFDAAINASPAKIIVKRPPKAPNLAERKPNYSLEGKAVRYDCYVYK